MVNYYRSLLIFAALMYINGSFVNSSFNTTTWTYDSRKAYAILFGFGSLVVAVAALANKMDESEKNTDDGAK